MCILRAPSERRKPISRVRSVTLASMMFMITIPPTTRKIAVSPTATVKILAVKDCQRPMMESEPMMPKLSGPSQGMCRHARNSMRASSSEADISSALCAWTNNTSESRCVPHSLLKVSRGMKTKLSCDCPSALPITADTPTIS